MSANNDNRCELCGRYGVNLTRHHLIPRTRHRNKRVRRKYDLETLTAGIMMACRPCHNHVHDVFTEKELADSFNNREKLAAHPDIAQYVEWIRTRPADFKPRSFAMNGRGKWSFARRRKCGVALRNVK